MKKPVKKINRKSKVKKNVIKPKGIKNTKNKPKRPGDVLTDAQKQELKKLSKKMQKTAKKVVSDYEKNPSEISGSTIQINQDSPYLDERLKGNQWKQVINKIPKGKKDLNRKVDTPKNSYKPPTIDIKKIKPSWMKKK